MKKIKKFLLNIWYGLPFGMKAAGDEILGSGESDGNDTSVSQEVSDQRVGKHLLKGEVTQEVSELRYRTYKVSNESGKYKYLGNGVAVKEEQGQKNTDKIKFSMENKLICATVLDELKRVNDYGIEKYRVEILYDGVVKFKLEQFATSVDVLIDTRYVLHYKDSIIETTLHFEKQANPYDAKSKPFINELARLAKIENEYELSRSEIASSLVSLSFTTYKTEGEDDFVNYSFIDGCKLKEIKETEHEFILTYSWNAFIRLPINLEAKYYSKEMDEKYKRKERKDTPVEMVQSERKAYCSVCGKEMSVYDADIMSADGHEAICQECLKKVLKNQ